MARRKRLFACAGGVRHRWTWRLGENDVDPKWKQRWCHQCGRWYSECEIPDWWAPEPPSGTVSGSHARLLVGWDESGPMIVDTWAGT